MADEISMDAVKASVLSIIPVFLFLIPSYLYFGYELPPAYEWAVWSVITVMVGLMTSLYLREEVDYTWAGLAGLSRWLLVAVIFSLKEVMRAGGIEPVSSVGRILTYQFVSELPLMILGYMVGVFIWKQLFLD